MSENETIANYVSKVSSLASDIEFQLSDKLKMVRIICRLPPKYNHYKTVWYNTKENRSIETLLSSLQLEEDNIIKNAIDENAMSNSAFSAKTKQKFKPKEHLSIEEKKKKTKAIFVTKSDTGLVNVFF